MHISEGVLAAPVLAVGAVVAVVAVALSVRKMPMEHIMGVAILASAFFVASLVHVPLGPGSVHLLLSGLMGAILGWAAIPAIAVALFLQALFFQFGGLTVLGVNICILALPAGICGLVFRPLLQKQKTRAVGGFLCGFSAIALAAVLCAMALAFSGDTFLLSARAIFVAHIPIMFIEGILTAGIVLFLGRAAPGMLFFSKQYAEN